MRKSKFLNCVIVACLGIIVAGSTKYVSQKMCYAEADIYDGNYHDIAFDYDNDNDIFEETDLYTEEREKRNTTSAYIYNNNSAARIPAIRVKAGDYKDCTYGSYQSCEVGEAKYLLNTVYEDGYRSARLWLDPGNGHHICVHFLWSPDSI